MIELRHRGDGRVLFAAEDAPTVREAVEAAVRRGADLGGADLGGARLCGADLRGADLSRADLRQADLDRADLDRADLRGADLRGARLNWWSHDLVAEILRRGAGADAERRQVAGLVLISRDWCWDRFLAIESPLRDWALGTLARCVTDGDEAPEILAEHAAELGRTEGPG